MIYVCKQLQLMQFTYVNTCNATGGFRFRNSHILFCHYYTCHIAILESRDPGSGTQQEAMSAIRMYY